MTTSRVVARDEATWREVATHDIFHDFVGADGIAIHPDGQLVAVPNGPPPRKRRGRWPCSVRRGGRLG
ncbi:MAG: hypothetical protein R3F43_27520 [bacterium]